MVSCVHLAKSFWGLSMLWHVSVLHSFSYLSYIPLYGQTMFWLSVHLSVGVWVVSTFGLLWIMRLWTFTCMSLCEHEHVRLVFLSIYLGGGISGSYSDSTLNFWGTARLFSTMAASFHISTSNNWGQPLFSSKFFGSVAYRGQPHSNKDQELSLLFNHESSLAISWFWKNWITIKDV